MYIFALDSSGRAASAAICRDGRIIASAFADMGLTHSQILMPLCHRVFEMAGLEPRDMDYFACSTGPGSFTGLRIGISAVKGMALAAGKPCVGVPVNEALAMSVSGFGGVAVTVSDARAERVFAASYDVKELPVPITPDEAIPISELSRIMPDKNGRYIFVGDGAELCYNALKEAFPNSTWGLLRLPSAHYCALCAVERVKREDTVDCSLLNPVYLQPSQAERALMERTNNG